MAKQICFNAFLMDAAGYLSAGSWRHSRDQAARCTDIRYWTELARTLERVYSDCLFLADVLGVYTGQRYPGAGLMACWTGIDFSRHAPDQVLREVPSDAIQSAVEAFTCADPTRTWTVAEIADYCAIGGDVPVFVGSPQTVADLVQEWNEDTDVDGFNLASVATPETFVALVDLLVPSLQRRGPFKCEYVHGTLRHKLFGQSDRLVAPHPLSVLLRRAG
ncbi:alkanesulfonate monooxygenase SsuD/methylene tetrahydromethanopterin reductase-like flavin-dependent oxidoreductase (luciferase family) [Pseudomonas psychrotolerans]|nr:alkanesulfonate monooxygenase SsuD/methylene tetrahydromethanopterin reductase-like flavin-dependent oxidoreductase (luciferase family) [Pseudomonas psychrotolerans]